MHDGREAIIGGRGHVDVVVWVYRLFRTHCASKYLNRSIGNDLICVHVRLGARACLPYNEWEMVNKLQRSYFFSSLLNRITQLRICDGLSWAAQRDVAQLPSPYFMLTVAAAPLSMPNALMTGGGIRS